MLQASVDPVLPSPHPVLGLCLCKRPLFLYLSGKIIFVSAVGSGELFFCLLLSSFLLASAGEEGRAC